MRLQTLILLCLTLLSLAGHAHSETANYSIGISVWSGYPDSVRGFKDALATAGLREDQGVQYIFRNAQGNKARQQEIAREFRELGVDMVYSLTTPGTIIIKEQLPDTTPIVFSVVTYPADAGLIESLEYSGNNLVGTSNYVPLNNYVSLLKNLLPATKTAAIFHRKGEPNSKIQAVGLTRLLRRAGIKVTQQQPSSLEEVSSMANAISATTDVFISTTDTLMQSGGEQRLIETSLKTGTPILSSNKQGIKDGSSFGPVADFYTLGQLSGQMAVRIIQQQQHPSSMSSKLQEPPLTLINKSSMTALKLDIPSDLSGVQYVD